MPNPQENAKRPVVLLFPGQGAQQALMGAGLYRHASVFTDAMDTVFRLLGQEGKSIRADWLSGDPSDLFDDVTRAQPLLFAVNYALGRTVMSWGIRPAALLGHSVGELAAAALAGVFSLADAARLMTERIKILADTPPGGMLAVAASPGEVERYLSGHVGIGAVNAPRQVLLAGPAGPLAAAERRLRADGFTCRMAKARQAFHSTLLSDAAERSTPGWRQTELRAPDLTIWSAYRGAVLSSDLARDPAFWARQPVDPVLFGPTLESMLDHGDYLLIEAGPGQGLTTLARRQPAVTSGRSAVAAMLPARAGDPSADRAAVLAVAERISTEGHDIDWDAVLK
ncbi:acyltransferase domain-containing protein [Micromonospora arborensis]|uniref:acyltransferase domain-containing protein n=1 Tax=Micromonospora arborensis TaxID=2116518 RepID=UPI0033DCD327